MAIKKSQVYNITKEQYDDKEYLQDLKEEFRKTIKDANDGIYITTKRLSKPKTFEIKNPIEGAGPKDAFRLASTPKQFYLRFGYLLQYVHENITPRIKIGDTHSDNPQIFDIDFSTWDNIMYSLPNQISLDPRVCLVRNSNFYSGNPQKNTQVFQQLPYFRQVDNGKADSNANVAYPMNIYLNFDFIIECLKTDDKGDVSVFEFLSSICTGLNKALGGINNLEPVIDESSNTLSIIDTTPIPGKTSNGKSSYLLQVYGYDKIGKNYISNFVRSVDLKTAITPEFATMITIGATAGGYVKGTEATAFSKWNTGLKDRFKEEFTPGNENSVQTSGDNEAETNYSEEFASWKGKVTRYGLTGLQGSFKLNTDAIERNLSVVTEYYKYIIAKEAKDQSNSGGTIGFIPFKLNLTLDGISGIKIYNKLSVNTEFLPKVYGERADLIVTGVSHILSKNDWTTQIETTLIPKTGKQSTAVILPETIQQSVNNGSQGNQPKAISSCNELPPAKGLSSSVKGLIKSSTTKDSTLVQVIVDYLEGGYYHPVHAYDSKTKQIKSSFSIYKNSGETLYGIDRYAGNTEGLREGPKNDTGVDFWKAVDAISGYGKYKTISRDKPTKDWEINKYPKNDPKKEVGWSWNYMPKKSDKGYDTLQKNLQKYITSQYNSFFKSYFGNHPVGKLVESDGRLKFMYYRATWNGVGFFQKYASNLKAKYDSGIKDINKLICADLTYRYNTKAKSFKPGVSKLDYMMDYQKPNS
jgi:hypothetical protein